MESRLAARSVRGAPRLLARRRLWLAVALAAALSAALSAALLGCDASPPTDPASAPDGLDDAAVDGEAPIGPRPGFSLDARFETYEMLRADQDAARHPADGGGRAWLDMDPPPRPAAATPAKLVVVYEAGALGVAEGGAVFLQPSPFWDWDPPQISYPELPGFTTVATEADGVELAQDDSSGAFVVVTIGGRALRPGERLRFVYGEGDVGARVDRFAEERSPLYVSVDGDGDGVRSVVRDGAVLDVLAHEPRQLHVAAQLTAQPGERVRVVVAALDALGNAARVSEGGVEIAGLPAGARAPGPIDLAGEAGGHAAFEISGLGAGTHRFELRGTGALAGLVASSNPVVVRDGIAPVLIGDLHGHSQLSDGTATPEQYFRYARDVAGLDVVSLTDHDHWGIVPLDRDPAAWDSIRAAVAQFHAPGRFVALLGFEWTSWLQGHRHVLYFDDGGAGELLSSLDPRYETPSQLWDALRGQPALTFAHHSAGGPVSTNWRDFPPDPVLEPVTEIVSVHGSSEAPDSPMPIYDAVPGNFVRNALDAGYVLGFVGSGDSHDGHPGLPQLADPSGSGGLAAIVGADRSRTGVLEALRARRVYATNGARIWLDVTLGGAPMGSRVEAASAGGEDEGATQEAAKQTLAIEVAATAPIERIDLIRSGQVASLDGEGRLDWTLVREIPPLRRGEYHYVRVVQHDGRAAWSSPIFAR